MLFNWEQLTQNIIMITIMIGLNFKLSQWIIKRLNNDVTILTYAVQAEANINIFKYLVRQQRCLTGIIIVNLLLWILMPVIVIYALFSI